MTQTAPDSPQTIAAEAANNCPPREQPVTGGLFRSSWFNGPNSRHQRTTLEGFDEVAISVDTAFSGDPASDFSVLQAWGRNGAVKYLVDQERGQWGYPDLLARAAAFRQRHGNPTVYISAGANGLELFTDLENGPGDKLVLVKPAGDKQSRAHFTAVAAEAGQVLIPLDELAAKDESGQPWTVEWVAEHVGFPNRRFDDQVDATSQLLVRWHTSIAAADNGAPPPKVGPQGPVSKQVERFFSYHRGDGGHGFELHGTEEEAKGRALRFIEEMADEVEYDDDTLDLIRATAWGEVRGWGAYTEREHDETCERQDGDQMGDCGLCGEVYTAVHHDTIVTEVRLEEVPQAPADDPEVAEVRAMSREEARRELDRCAGGLDALDEAGHAEATHEVRSRLTSRAMRLQSRLREPDPDDLRVNLTRAHAALRELLDAKEAWDSIHWEHPDFSRAYDRWVAAQRAAREILSPVPGGTEGQVAGAPRPVEAKATGEGDASPAPSPVLASEDGLPCEPAPGSVS